MPAILIGKRMRKSLSGMGSSTMWAWFFQMDMILG